jgi:hypothetical protein
VLEPRPGRSYAHTRANCAISACISPGVRAKPAARFEHHERGPRLPFPTAANVDGESRHAYRSVLENWLRRREGGKDDKEDAGQN